MFVGFSMFSMHATMYKSLVLAQKSRLAKILASKLYLKVKLINSYELETSQEYKQIKQINRNLLKI